jgi:hypothetical protein
MSFLNSNNSEYLSARITQRGRNAIAKGSFNIEYFQVGDSEFDYTTPFTGLTGQTTHQKVLSPIEKECGVKYPYKLDTSSTTTTYGNPIQNSVTNTIRNIMGPAGFVSNYIEYDNVTCIGTTVECGVEEISLTALSGTTTLVVPSGNTFVDCEYITVVLDRFNGPTPTLTGQTNSYVYKIVSITTGTTQNVLTLDRKTVNLSSLSGYAQVICNDCEQEFPNTTEIADVCLPEPVDFSGQLNSWTMNIVWDDKPIGSDYSGEDETLTGFTSNQFVSTKEFLGYNSNSQIFTNFTGGTISNPTSFINSYGETMDVLSTEQRCVAIIHYSELGDLRNDPERFYKYDDYVSHKTGITGSDISIVDDENGDPISDTEYFEIYIPFIQYHRNTGTTIGALFTMDTVDYYIKPTSGLLDSRFQLLFRYLLDEQGVKVGKIFPTKKIVVFDDQELVAVLDYRSNRKYTLPSPKISTVPSDTTAADSMLTGTTGQTVWVTYMFENTTNNTIHSLPCNYFNKVTGTTVPSQVTLKFSGSTSGATTFSTMKTSFSNVIDGFVANKFYALVQIQNSIGEMPTSNLWKKVDLTSQIPGYVSGYINPTSLLDKTFTIYYSGYTGSTNYFDLEDHMSGLSVNYMSDTTLTGSTVPQFGDEQPFPGSIRLVRATDIEQMKFLVNLPSVQFLETQNPTYSTGKQKMITEIALLDSNKEPLVVAKSAIPIKRIGTQVFAVKLDF